MGHRCVYWICLNMLLAGMTVPANGEHQSPLQWKSMTPREEISPVFSRVQPDATEGENQPTELLRITADHREGLVGYWQTELSVQGGQHYRIEVFRRTTGVDHPARCCVARLLWLDEQGQKALRDEPTDASYRPGTRPLAEPDFLPATGQRRGEWVELQQTHRAPQEAARLQLQLWYRWEAEGQVEWKNPSITQVPAPPARTVRLATVHYRPHGGSTNLEKCRQFAPLIAEAAEQEADLVVLPETLTYFGRKLSYADCAEPVPGPCTAYFGKLARKHNLYIVAGLLERAAHQVFNVAVLIGPDGKVAGRYRKVCLPRGEIEGGLTPGREYPVFSTRFGKVGMMVCYDGFFPEVARQLSNNGAEVIAWPVWGCNPLLASARACENHVYLISSTYTDPSADWMISAVYGHDGKPLTQAKQWGEVKVTEVDLNQPLYWHSLGNFKAQIPHHQPR